MFARTLGFLLTLGLLSSVSSKACGPCSRVACCQPLPWPSCNTAVHGPARPHMNGAPVNVSLTACRCWGGWCSPAWPGGFDRHTRDGTWPRGQEGRGGEGRGGEGKGGEGRRREVVGLKYSAGHMIQVSTATHTHTHMCRGRGSRQAASVDRLWEAATTRLLCGNLLHQNCSWVLPPPHSVFQKPGIDLQQFLERYPSGHPLPRFIEMKKMLHSTPAACISLCETDTTKPCSLQRPS